MWNSSGYIIIALFFVFASCKKDKILPYDREKELQTDTTALIYSQKVTLNSSTEFVIELEVSQFTDLISRANYPSKTFENSVDIDNPNVEITFGVEEQKEYESIDSYSTIVMLDENAIHWYDYNQVGFNLRRYFETIDQSVNKTAALYLYKEKSDELTTTFVTDETANAFKTGWEKKINEIYLLSRSISNNDYYGKISKESFYKTMNEALDKLINDPNATGQKSITSLVGNCTIFFTENPYLDTELMALIGKAVSNNIQINFITENSKDLVHFVAYQTNGFLHGDLYENGKIADVDYTKVSHKAVALQNLDKLLSKDLTTKKVMLTVNAKTGWSFETGQRFNVGVRFLSYEFNLFVVLP